MATYAQPENSPALRDDLFPAQVYVPHPDTDLLTLDPPPPTATNWVPTGAELLFRPARVLFSATHLWIFEDSPDGPRLHTHAALDDIQGTRRQGFRVVLAPSASNPEPSPAQMIITRYAHCGCGSRLRSFRPFAHMRLLSDSKAPAVSH